MSTRVEATHQETQVLAHVHGAGLHFTENRRTILAVFLAATEPVTITDLWLRAKKDRYISNLNSFTYATSSCAQCLPAVYSWKISGSPVVLA